MASCCPAVCQTTRFGDGRQIPTLGFGTWQLGSVSRSIETAIDKGFRHFDCAAEYMNEAEIGTVFKKVISNNKLRREELFITSKLWNTDHEPKEVEAACRRTLRNLGLAYLDLYLIHYPVSFPHPATDAFETKEDFYPTVDGNLVNTQVPLIETWKAMEALVDLGLVKSLGVSNFNEEQLSSIYTFARIKPVCNQIECSIALPQLQLRRVHERLGIVTVAYCPLGACNERDETPLVDEKEVCELAKTFGFKSPAEMLLRWCLMHNMVVLTKSSSAKHIEAAAHITTQPLHADLLNELRKISQRFGRRAVNPIFCNGQPCFPELTPRDLEW